MLHKRMQCMCDSVVINMAGLITHETSQSVWKKSGCSNIDTPRFGPFKEPITRFAYLHTSYMYKRPMYNTFVSFLFFFLLFLLIDQHISG